MMQPGAAQVCYFDITDVVRWAMRNTRVSGIQRVQLNLIAHMARIHGGHLVRCIFEHPDLKVMFEFDPTTVFDSDEFDSEMLLRQLDLSGRSAIFPSKLRVRKHLKQYRDNKLKRAATKIDIYVSALVFPRRLARFGMRRPTAAEMAVQPAAVRRIEILPAEGFLVLLGATWTIPYATEFARAHAARGGTVVQVIYDLIPHLRPEFFSSKLTDAFNRWLREVVRYTRRFICISRQTAADLRHVIGPREDIRIHAVAMAHQLEGFERFARVELDGGTAMEAADSPFVLCVGTLEVRKNGAMLLRAWARLAAKLGDRLPRLVFAGKQGWLIHEFEAALANDPELARGVRIVDSPSDRELAYLYQRCLFTAYPSLYEGWGLPVGEAAWFGKFVISSNAASLPEVCGDLIDYFDPTDLDALCANLERAITEPDYVRRKEQIIAQSPMRRWSDVADDVFAYIVASDKEPSCAGRSAG